MYLFCSLLLLNWSIYILYYIYWPCLSSPLPPFINPASCIVLFLPAQRSGVEMIQSQRTPVSGVTEENNEISEGKIHHRETGGKPGERKHWNGKDWRIPSVVSLWSSGFKTPSMKHERDFSFFKGDSLWIAVSGRQPVILQERLWKGK